MKADYIKGLASVWPEEEGQAPQTVYFQPPKNKKYDAEWFVVWKNESDIGVSMTEQAKMEKPLTQTEYRVRDFLMGTIGIGNFVYVNQAEVGRELRLTPANVCNAIKRLISLQILIQGPKSGRNNTYMVNPAFCFAGTLGKGIKERKAKILEFKESKKQEVEQLSLLPNV